MTVQVVEQHDVSIHPRVENGKTVHKKVNTCSPRSQRNGGAGGKVFRKVSEALKIRQRSWDAMSNEDKASTKRPGSMKP